ncbi:MAG: glycoside hydrolase family 65 protein [Chloroflexi bacterium]|nr:glycoside hydrolase family 65 protein [Chloroflexota bacterium]
MWTISETQFEPLDLHHQETIFTIGNGYLCTRGTFEEGYPGDRGATFIHGVFDAARNVNTEIVNEPDWLPLTVYLNGERFGINHGVVASYRRTLSVRDGLLTRTVVWQSPGGHRATFTFERFASLADPHALYLRCHIVPEFSGTLEFRASLNGHTDNLGVVHTYWVDQGERDGVVYLDNRTRETKIETAYAMRVQTTTGHQLSRAVWAVENKPCVMVRVQARPGNEIVLDKQVVVYTSRDVPAEQVVSTTLEHLNNVAAWDQAVEKNAEAWEDAWENSDAVIEGDDEAQRAVRFNLYQLHIVAPRRDDRVSIGAKALSGFGYRGHAFWDAEIFMLPFFTHTAPAIARNLLDYRYRHLEAARAKAKANGCEGAQFAWESADTGEEVTPTWIPDPADRRRLIRIWTGDIEIHISADIAYAAHHYWRMTGDDTWYIEKGVELILDTAKFWASRAEWDAENQRYEYNDVIGPDEYHDHVNNNAYTNRMAQWNLQTALDVLDWLNAEAPARANELVNELDLTPARLAQWQDVIQKVYVPIPPSGVIEQFEGYCNLKPVYMAALEPRDISTQQLFGIEGSNQRQAIKQPDVLMLLYLLREHYADDIVRVNYDFYAPRTDSTYGSSLGPGIQAIIACEVGKPDEAYKLFQLAAESDLYDLRRNASDGIHAASCGATWQAVVFGFAGLRITETGWTVANRLPSGWTRLAFKFLHRGKLQRVELTA